MSKRGSAVDVKEGFSSDVALNLNGKKRPIVAIGIDAVFIVC
jgi:hypothetical protein